MTDAVPDELAALRKEIEALRTEVTRCLCTPITRAAHGLDAFRNHAADAVLAGELTRATEVLETQPRNRPVKDQCLPQCEQTLAVALQHLKT